MSLRVIGAGVGRTGTHSLKIALEALLSGPCHHMVEVFAHPEQVPVWINAIDGHPVDWSALMAGYVAQVDWPGASFWPELLEDNPDALVILSVRDPQAWYTSANNTIFAGMERNDDELAPWMAAMKRLLGNRFSNDLGNPDAMIAAFEQHNETVRSQVPADRLLEWSPDDGWQPLCNRLERPVPEQPFPLTNTTAQFQARLAAQSEA
ncbi:MAG: sulfotransferase family protein [Acidobacteriota bacterium]|nr:sulfotransferase family protein [Acidobacteriota bacterium]